MDEMKDDSPFRHIGKQTPTLANYWSVVLWPATPITTKRRFLVGSETYRVEKKIKIYEHFSEFLKMKITLIEYFLV